MEIDRQQWPSCRDERKPKFSDSGEHLDRKAAILVRLPNKIDAKIVADDTRQSMDRIKCLETTLWAAGNLSESQSVISSSPKVAVL